MKSLVNFILAIAVSGLNATAGATQKAEIIIGTGVVTSAILALATNISAKNNNYEKLYELCEIVEIEEDTIGKTIKKTVEFYKNLIKEVREKDANLEDLIIRYENVKEEKDKLLEERSENIKELQEAVKNINKIQVSVKHGTNIIINTSDLLEEDLSEKHKGEIERIKKSALEMCEVVNSFGKKRNE